MGPFVCKSCSSPSEQAARCPVCGSRTFELSEDARTAADPVLGRPEPRGKLISITSAPSFRRRRRHLVVQ
ncbi:MAG TPA: hypothetical protein VFR97_07035 [Capillimicrobium sp.]|nr:hypothetical protein [Capillimicrobium sp.]